ncbi:class I SAM-dependent methyltransferase [Luteimonas deserti]|uniref:Class I SAM-dependent methyltransferase n=1 Tax=Luteimonas deserti TaxID=2752306 RepID=A0A7Z0TT47_9GAMM|nr:class I SAM-dependent methyltransferase [Luteimonas deserti]NYZ61431.1 class I SAM-dependent methyltransferase [Luteimonas deserti]
MQRSLLLGAVLLALTACSGPQTRADSASDLDAANVERLDAAVAGAWRSAENRARDGARNPAETLRFFGVRPGQTVIEITPGSGAWYAEILAPYLHDNGQYIAAMVDPASAAEGRARDYQQGQRDGLQAKFDAAPAQFGRARMVAFDPKAPRFGPAASADVVLTFRNVHNWRMSGNAEAMFKGFYDVLRPGGVLGVVEHRARADVPADDRSGYVGQSQVIALAQAAGFRVDGSSEINANPRDTRDHPNGVWMLPPSNRHEPQDAARFTAIGESDRMTLRFVKP